MIMHASTPRANAHLLENNHYQWHNTAHWKYSGHITNVYIQLCKRIGSKMTSLITSLPSQICSPLLEYTENATFWGEGEGGTVCSSVDFVCDCHKLDMSQCISVAVNFAVALVKLLQWPWVPKSPEFHRNTTLDEPKWIPSKKWHLHSFAYDMKGVLFCMVIEMKLRPFTYWASVLPYG